MFSFFRYVREDDYYKRAFEVKIGMDDSVAMDLFIFWLSRRGFVDSFFDSEMFVQRNVSLKIRSTGQGNRD